MKICVNGSRGFDNYPQLEWFVSYWIARASEKSKKEAAPTVEIVSGAAKGADILGERFAVNVGAEVKLFKPEWERWGKRAGLVRNQEMAHYSDFMVSFWDGVSRGTFHAMKYMLTIRKPVRVLVYDGNAESDYKLAELIHLAGADTKLIVIANAKTRLP